MYNFKRLISKYSKLHVYYLEEAEGYHDPTQGGKWIPGVITEVEIEGAIIPLSNEDLRFDEGGTYMQSDRKLYCYKEMVKGTKIKHDSKNYTILEGKTYKDFDIGLYIYVVRRGDKD